MTEPTPNDRQEDLIENTEGLYLVDAGPGTGKTFAITRRYGTIVDQPDVDQFVEMVVEIVGFDIDRGLEIGSTQFVVGDERAQDPEPRRVADRLLHREILLERQPALLRERRLRLANVLCWLAIGFGH